MKTKFKTAWKLFSRSERLECESVTLKWNICECLVGCINVKAGRIDSRYKAVLKEESVLWKWEYRLSVVEGTRLRKLTSRSGTVLLRRLSYVACIVTLANTLLRHSSYTVYIVTLTSRLVLRHCGTPVKWRHDWYCVTTALQLNDVTTGNALLRHFS